MIAALGRILDDYPGDPNRARCFNHVIALLAKRMTRQFDVAKGEADAALDEAEKELGNLAEEIDIEEMLTQANQDEDEDVDNDDDDDDMEDDLSPADRKELDASTRPVKLVLVKVSSVVFCNSESAHLSWMDFVASKDRVRHDPLYNNSLAVVVPDTGEVEIGGTQDAA